MCCLRIVAQVAGTHLNEFSSRSHTIVRLYIECSNARRPGDDLCDLVCNTAIFVESSQSQAEALIKGSEDELVKKSEEEVEGIMVSTINFVDLAGSERSSNSGIQDSEERLRLKEVVVTCSV